MALGTKIYEYLIEAAGIEVQGEFENYAERLVAAITEEKGKWWNNQNILHICAYLKELKVPADETKEKAVGLLEKFRDADTLFNQAEGAYQRKDYAGARKILEDTKNKYTSIGLSKPQTLEHIKNLEYSIASAEKYARLQKKAK